ncbi:MAG: phenylalanine--tRNA ligase subunit beta [Candidatus Woesebacteria bacterium]|jgi:phenylalanyl-tRNA synthetase beta chain
MLAPISWIKEYTKIKSTLKDLMWKMTEAGLTTETYIKEGNQIVLDIEVTPNRPDWLSIIGVAREIAVIENSKLKLPELSELKKTDENLPISVNVDKKLVGRYSAVTLANVDVAPSPEWMQKRLKLVGFRPINNIVDTTNYVMLETGIPIHAFDYDKLDDNSLTVMLSKGGEKFRSVDGISYKLPKNALIIKDTDRVIDLAAIKGGENTQITKTTKNIFIHVPIYDPVLTRKTSQRMKLASDASYIYERGPDLGGTLKTLKRTVGLVKEIAGGKVASDIIDIKAKDYKPTKLSVSLAKISQVLGEEIKTERVNNILTNLNLSPDIKKDKIICIIPTFRSDLVRDVDLIEEIARIYGYNKFSKTLPVSQTPKEKVAFSFNYDFLYYLKSLMVASGFTEVMTYSLISEETIRHSRMDVASHIKLQNPVSAEYKYIQMSLIPTLLTSIQQNPQRVSFFELSKIYLGDFQKPKEPYKLSAATNKLNFSQVKGVVELILERLNISEPMIKKTAAKRGMWHPVKSGVIEVGNKMVGTFGELNPQVINNFEIENDILAFELDVKTLEALSKQVFYSPVNKYPAQIEDVTFKLSKRTGVGEVISAIKNTSVRIDRVKLIDTYNSSYTFRIWYQHPGKTLTDKEVKKIRGKVEKALKKKFNIRV